MVGNDHLHSVNKKNVNNVTSDSLIVDVKFECHPHSTVECCWSVVIFTDDSFFFIFEPTDFCYMGQLLLSPLCEKKNNFLHAIFNVVPCDEQLHNIANEIHTWQS